MPPRSSAGYLTDTCLQLARVFLRAKGANRWSDQPIRRGLLQAALATSALPTVWSFSMLDCHITTSSERIVVIARG